VDAGEGSGYDIEEATNLAPAIHSKLQALDNPCSHRTHFDRFVLLGALARTHGSSETARVFTHRLAILALRLFVLFTCLSCGGESMDDPRPRLVLLYATCTVNANYLSPYDERVDFTPNLQRFADEGIVFQRHTTEAGQSGIAFASIFSGSQADHHQMYRHPLAMSEDVYLVSEAYAEQGYETFIWNRHAEASPELGYAQGIPVPNRHEGLIDPEGDAFQEILERLATDTDYRAFVMTNFTLTHSPYTTDPLQSFLKAYPDRANELTTRQIMDLSRIHTKDNIGLSYNHDATVSRLGLSPTRLKDLYRAIAVVYTSNIFELDRHFGSVIDAIRSSGLLDESLIVFTADHGEVVDRENALYPWSHAMQLAPEVLRVPLIIRAPRLDVSPGVYEGVTRSIDVLPTMAGLSSFELGDRMGIDGVDLTASIRRLEPAPELLGFSHTSVLVRAVHNQLRTLYGSRLWKALGVNTPDQNVRRVWVRIRDGDMVFKRYRLGKGDWRYSAFDLSGDPEERVELFDRDDLAHAEMARRLDVYWLKLVDRYGTERAGKNLPPEIEEEALRSLGYIE
jgi:arylsulfatase A-like enzyme